MSLLNTLQKQNQKPAARNIVETLTVLSVEKVSQNIHRITFDDASKKLSPEDESGYLKLQFQQNNQVVLRSYTILKVVDNTVTIDFVIHGAGFGSKWAEHAKVGDVLMSGSAGATKLVDTNYDWFILMGDLTALPSITVNLKKLPKDAKGFAVIEVLENSEIQEIEKPNNFEVEWIVNNKPEDSAQLMLSAVQNKKWLDGKPYIWVAGEFDSARALRQYFRKEKEADKTNFYVSSYWKVGVSDEGNKKAKKADGGF